MKMQRLLFWLLLLQCPSYPNPNLVHVVPDRFILGLDGAGVLWNFAILTGYLGICAFLIYIWRTVLAIAPRQYEVTLQQIAEKIHRLKNENRELAKEISIWEEKIRERKKHRAEMKREHQFLSDKILKLKENIGKVERVNANLSVALHFKRTMLQAMREKNVKNEDMAQDALEDEEQGALESKKRVLKESKKVLEQKCNALSSLKAAKEVELKLLRKKLGIVMDFSERRKVAAEEKLEKTLYELEATKNQLSDAEENLKVTKEEIDKYKQQIGKMQDQLQEAELTFERKIAVHEKNAVGNWIKARVWERKIQQQRRENAYMIHRLRMMKGQMLPEGCMRQEAMLGRPEMWSPPRRGGSRCERVSSAHLHALPYGPNFTRLHWLWATSASSTLVDMRASPAPRSSTMWASVPFRSLWRSRGQQWHRSQGGPREGQGPLLQSILHQSSWIVQSPPSLQVVEADILQQPWGHGWAKVSRSVCPHSALERRVTALLQPRE
ncbi:transport and Golgi organization protein 1 homolog isoform X9 [Ursus americanus]|uniref:transport and Golgi organization protein 1 homolog isoform X9 n=1 Tax=Ursus americanus TaxID=9643 RepID=UPI001E679BF3|nr:transport and Golgi organization protein 1 homolog isoform X9 [Ursus americanus]